MLGGGTSGGEFLVVLIAASSYVNDPKPALRGLASRLNSIVVLVQGWYKIGRNQVVGLPACKRRMEQLSRFLDVLSW